MSPQSLFYAILLLFPTRSLYSQDDPGRLDELKGYQELQVGADRQLQAGGES